MYLAKGLIFCLFLVLNLWLKIAKKLNGHHVVYHVASKSIHSVTELNAIPLAKRYGGSSHVPMLCPLGPPGKIVQPMFVIRKVSKVGKELLVKALLRIMTPKLAYQTKILAVNNSNLTILNH